MAAPSRPSALSKVVLLVNADLKHSGKYISASPVTERMIKAFRSVISQEHPQVAVEIVTPAMVRYHSFSVEPGTILCPLTIDLPEQVAFSQRQVFDDCRHIDARRQWVLSNTDHKVCGHGILGDHWLPIIFTEKDPLYGEVIGEGVMPNSYHQPIDLREHHRQPLHNLGYQLLRSISAQPGVYLMQFAFSPDKDILFDRLWPFPAAPAIASLNRQQPDLFTCHWRCLTKEPVVDGHFGHHLAS